MNYTEDDDSHVSDTDHEMTNEMHETKKEEHENSVDEDEKDKKQEESNVDESQTENSDSENDLADESVIGRRPKSKKNKAYLIESDESEEELEYERRALSPSTRRSIGVFVAQSSDESDIEEEEEEQQESDEEEYEQESSNSNVQNTKKYEKDVEQNVADKSLEHKPEKRETTYKLRPSEFETSIQQKVSSTMAPMNDNDQECTIINDSLDDSVEEIKKSEEVLEISSSFDESDIPKTGALQPKIKNLLVKVSLIVVSTS